MRKFLVLLLGCLVVVLAASPAQAKSAYKVTVKVDDTSVNYNDPVTVSGTVTPSSSSSVKIYIKGATDSDYYLGATVTLKSGGKFKRTFYPDDSGTTTYKVVKAKSSSRGAGSATVKVKVYGELDVTQLTRKVISGTAEDGDFQSGNGTFYDGGALRLKQASAHTYNAQVRLDLKEQCRSYDGYSGIDDRSPAGSDGNEVVSSTTSSGKTLTNDGVESAQRFGDVNFRDFKLYTKSSKGTVTRARYLVISTQTDAPSGIPLWGIDASVTCNLPGAKVVLD